MSTLAEENTRVRGLRDRLEETILKTIPNTVRNGAKEPRLPNTANIAFEFVEAEAILMMLDQLGICASSGSACTTGSVDPSHVLTAMNVSPMRARGSVRFSLGLYNTSDEVEYVLQQLPGVIAKLRAISPLDPKHPDNDRFDLKAARQKHDHAAGQPHSEPDDDTVIV
jgi:cysteine desulfurase